MNVIAALYLPICLMDPSLPGSLHSESLSQFSVIARYISSKHLTITYIN